MAYTPITNSEIDPDSPLTTGLFSKLRDNMDFGRNVVTGFIETSAFVTGSIAGTIVTTNSMNGDRIITGSITATQMGAQSVGMSELIAPTLGNTFVVKRLIGSSLIATGDNGYDSANTFKQGGSSTSCGFTLLIDGSVRLHFTTHFIFGAGDPNSDTRLLKNGVTIGSWATTQADGEVVRTATCSGICGDHFMLQQKANTGGGIAEWKDVYVTSGTNVPAVA